MSELTTSSMHDARDAEEQRLLDAGELSLLVESYYGVMLRQGRGGRAREVAERGLYGVLERARRRIRL